MKKATILFALLITTFITRAGVNGETPTTFPSKINLDAELNIEKADISSVQSLNVIYAFNNSCTASITVTVRIGINSSYVEANVTISGVPCDAIASEIRRLKALLQKAIE